MSGKSSDPQATEARRALVLQALATVCSTAEDGLAHPGTVNDLLCNWIDSGLIKWPQAKWPGARQRPYTGGTSQHLGQLAYLGLIEHERRRGYRPKGPDGGLRRRAPDVLRLKSQDPSLSLQEIADALEISTSLADSLMRDPTGQKERERKRGYCPTCGTKKEPNAVVCGKCQQKKADELLPPETFKVYLDRADEQGVEMIFGVTPDFRRVIRCGTWRAYEEYVVRDDLTWLDGLKEFQEAIGVELV